MGLVPAKRNMNRGEYINHKVDYRWEKRQEQGREETGKRGRKQKGGGRGKKGYKL